jgi:hypothetical protein
MDVLAIILRIVHIGTGIMWAGGAALFFFYLEPTMTTLGPAAEPFVNEMINRRKAPIYFAATSTFTVLAGAILYWRDSGGLQVSWITTATGLAFTIGGISALIAWLGSNLLIPRTIGEMGPITDEMKRAGGPPSPELMGRLHAVQERLRAVGLADLLLIGIAVLAMASARFLA